MNLFKQSLQHKSKIMIFYIDGNNNVTQRIIRVINIDDDAVVAFCFWRKKVRTFKINNILSTGPINKKVGA